MNEPRAERFAVIDAGTNSIKFHLGEILGHRFARHGHAVTVEEPRFQEHFHERQRAADFNEFHHHVCR